MYLMVTGLRATTTLLKAVFQGVTKLTDWGVSD